MTDRFPRDSHKRKWERKRLKAAEQEARRQGLLSFEYEFSNGHIVRYVLNPRGHFEKAAPAAFLPAIDGFKAVERRKYRGPLK